MGEEVEELVKHLREAYEQSGGINSSSGAVRLLGDAADAIEILARWKADALYVESTWDEQAVGKLIPGLKWGDNIRAAIQPALESLRASLTRAEAERERIVGLIAERRETCELDYQHFVKIDDAVGARWEEGARDICDEILRDIKVGNHPIGLSRASGPEGEANGSIEDVRE